jgi:hypothetical protein
MGGSLLELPDEEGPSVQYSNLSFSLSPYELRIQNDVAFNSKMN